MFGSKDKEKHKGKGFVEKATAAPTPAPHSGMTPKPAVKEQTVIGEGASLTGNLRIEGNIVIHGEIEGTVNCTGSLLVAKSGRIKGEIETRDASVAGRVEGKIFAKERVELQTGSHLEGDVQARTFMIQDGVFFQGNCSMGEPRKASSTEVPGPDGRKPDLGILKQS